MIRNAPSTGEPSRVLIAAKLPADAMIVSGHRRSVLLRQVHRQRPEAATDRDQRPLGPEHRTQAERGQRRENDAHELPAAGRTAARLESESG